YHPDKNASNPEASELFKEVAYSYNILSDPEKRRQYDMAGFEAIEAEGMDMEIDLSNLGTVNTMFAALFSKLGVPIKTTISANVLEEALNGTVTVRPLPIGTSVSGKVEKQNAHFFGVTISDEQAEAGIVVRVTSAAQSKFKLLYFEHDANGGYGLALQVMHFTLLILHCVLSEDLYSQLLRVDTGFELIFRLSRDHIMATKEYLKTCLVGNLRRMWSQRRWQLIGLWRLVDTRVLGEGLRWMWGSYLLLERCGETSGCKIQKRREDILVLNVVVWRHIVGALSCLESGFIDVHYNLADLARVRVLVRRKGLRLKAGTHIFAVYGDNFFKPASYTIEALCAKTYEDTTHKLQDIEAQILRKRNELRQFETEYRKALARFQEVTNRYSQEKQSVDELLKQRDSIHSSFTVTRTVATISGSGSGHFSNGSSSKLSGEDFKADSPSEDGSSDSKEKYSKRKWFNLNLKGSDKK
ncbi:PREDICTED: chaperone protein dnaJ 15-like, partial [Nicotiana attenuata]|uniref:chaperone protein dnaJ 15-like n=1 Tax=Nicotiana attenuata TaxID=49451 RepID=UPI000905225A